MTDKQIIIDDYFNIMRDDYGRIYCIQEIGDTKELIKVIREQNEYTKAKEQECERLNDKIDNIRDFAKQGRDMFVEQGSFADWYKVAECMKNDFNFILYEIDDEE